MSGGGRDRTGRAAATDLKRHECVDGNQNGAQRWQHWAIRHHRERSEWLYQQHDGEFRFTDGVEWASRWDLHGDREFTGRWLDHDLFSDKRHRHDEWQQCGGELVDCFCRNAGDSGGDQWTGLSRLQQRWPDHRGNGGGGDIGLAGVTVSFYGSSGNACGSTTTNATGNYSFTPTCTGPWRVEFSNVPSGYEPTSRGTGNGTSTQFVTTSGATNINFGVNYPADYCQNNPSLCAPVHVNNSTNVGTPTRTMLRFAASARGTSPTLTTVADKSEIGSTWGVAYNRSTASLYAAAFLKRHVGLGPNGLGAIYEIPNVNGTAGTPTLLIDVSTVAGVDVGTIGSNAARGLTGAPSAPSADPTAFPLVGKIGLGDIDISDDSTTLYTINLNERTLLSIPIAAPATLTEYPIPTDYCAKAVDAAAGSIIFQCPGR